eukprot:340492_1
MFILFQFLDFNVFNMLQIEEYALNGVKNITIDRKRYDLNCSTCLRTPIRNKTCYLGSINNIFRWEKPLGLTRHSSIWLIQTIPNRQHYAIKINFDAMHCNRNTFNEYIISQQLYEYDASLNIAWDNDTALKF